MSHFTVLVTGENIDDQLDAFSCEPCYAGYEEFGVDVYANEFESKAKEIIDGLDGSPKLKRKYQDCLEAKNFAEIFRCWFGGELDLETGNWGYWRNPNAKWDWYLLGGRWINFFKLKKDRTGVHGESGINNELPKRGYADSALLKDIDSDYMVKQWAKIYRKKWTEYKKSLNFPVDIKHQAQEMFDIAEHDTRTSYVTRMATIGHNVFAILHEGRWLERGDMGWFATVTNQIPILEWDNELKSVLSTLTPDTRLSLVDCHI